MQMFMDNVQIWMSSGRTQRAAS